jgi:hypothetical protein
MLRYLAIFAVLAQRGELLRQLVGLLNRTHPICRGSYTKHLHKLSFSCHEQFRATVRALLAR